MVTAELSISFISALFCPHVSSSLPDSNGVINRVGRIRCASHSQEVRWIFPPSRYGWEKQISLDVRNTFTFIGLLITLYVPIDIELKISFELY